MFKTKPPQENHPKNMAAINMQFKPNNRASNLWRNLFNIFPHLSNNRFFLNVPLFELKMDGEGTESFFKNYGVTRCCKKIVRG